MLIREIPNFKLNKGHLHVMPKSMAMIRSGRGSSIVTTNRLRGISELADLVLGLCVFNQVKCREEILLLRYLVKEHRPT